MIIIPKARYTENTKMLTNHFCGSRKKRGSRRTPRWTKKKDIIGLRLSNDLRAKNHPLMSVAWKNL